MIFQQPYGVNQVGPTAKFETTNSEGGGLMGVGNKFIFIY